MIDGVDMTEYIDCSPLVDDILAHPIGARKDISAAWLEREDRPSVSAETCLGEAEVLEHTVRELASGVWANGFVCPDENRGLIQIRDMRDDPGMVVLLIERIVRGLGAARYTYRKQDFGVFSIYEVPLILSRLDDYMNARPVTRLGRILLHAEMAADAAWFIQGRELLLADEAIGRSVRHQEIIQAIYLSGSSYEMSRDRIYNLRTTARAFEQMGLHRIEEVYGCVFEWAYRLAYHYRAKRLTTYQVKRILAEMRRHYKSPACDFTRLKTIEGLEQIKRDLDLARFDENKAEVAA
jgi:hypothetical protein